MKTLKDNRTYYMVSFADWLTQRYPEVNLLDWQIEVANMLLNQPRVAGKTFLIKLLTEYDQDAS